MFFDLGLGFIKRLMFGCFRKSRFQSTVVLCYGIILYFFFSRLRSRKFRLGIALELPEDFKFLYCLSGLEFWINCIQFQFPVANLWISFQIFENAKPAKVTDTNVTVNKWRQWRLEAIQHFSSKRLDQTRHKVDNSFSAFVNVNCFKLHGSENI